MSTIVLGEFSRRVQKRDATLQTSRSSTKFPFYPFHCKRKSEKTEFDAAWTSVCENNEQQPRDRRINKGSVIVQRGMESANFCWSEGIIFFLFFHARGTLP